MVRSAGNRDSRVTFGVDQGSNCGCQSHDPCGLWGNGETTEEVLPRAPRVKTARASKVIQPQSSNVRSFVPLLQGVGPVVKISNKGGHPHTPLGETRGQGQAWDLRIHYQHVCRSKTPLELAQ